MALELSDVVDLIHPASGVSAVLVGDQVWVLFDREIDESSVSDGNFYVTGPETDTWSGPDLSKWDIGHDGEDALLSPGLTGIVPGTLTFERINLGDLNEFTGTDVTGSGLLFRTKAVFTPERAFTPDTQFTVYITGDEDSTDNLKTGVKPRSVFDAEHAGPGSDDLKFTGSWESPGFANDIINVRIVDSGVKKTATFEYWFDSDPLEIVGPILTETTVFLNQGIYALFGIGTFIPGDEYSAVLKKVDPVLGSFYWTFSTGSGSIQVIPITTATSIIGDPVPVSSLVPTFALSTISPVDRATNLPLTTRQVVLTFTKDVDSGSVTADRIKMLGLPVNGDPNVLTEREIFKDITVTGNKIILDF